MQLNQLALAASLTVLLLSFFLSLTLSLSPCYCVQKKADLLVRAKREADEGWTLVTRGGGWRAC